jgi:hypothetical protein
MKFFKKYLFTRRGKRGQYLASRKNSKYSGKDSLYEKKRQVKDKVKKDVGCKSKCDQHETVDDCLYGSQIPRKYKILNLSKSTTHRKKGHSDDFKTKSDNKVWCVLLSVCLLIVISFCRSPVLVKQTKADSFYPSGDGSYCEFAQTVALSYTDLPDSGKNNVFYDVDLVKGQKGDFFAKSTFFDVGEIRYPNARRDNNVADYVALPPGAIARLGMFIFNYSGHPVTLQSGFLFVSQNDASKGNLNNVGAKGQWIETSFISQGTRITRKGYAYQLGNLGTWQASSWSNPPRGIVLREFETIQPIHIVDRNVEAKVRGESLFLDVNLILRNVSSYDLADIKIRDELINSYVFEKTINISKNQEKEINYSQEIKNDYPLSFKISPVHIYDPNSHVESAGIGADSGFTKNPDTKILLTHRGDVGAPSTWSGMQGDFAALPRGDFISIELLPYEIRSRSVKIELAPDLEVHKTVSCDDIHFASEVTCHATGSKFFKIIVKNNGARAEDFVLRDIMDDSMIQYLENHDFIKNSSGDLDLTIDQLHNNKKVEFTFEIKLIDPNIEEDIRLVNDVYIICDSNYCEGIDDKAVLNVLGVDEDVEDDGRQDANDFSGKFESDKTNQYSIRNRGDFDSLARTGKDITSLFGIGFLWLIKEGFIKFLDCF